MTDSDHHDQESSGRATRRDVLAGTAAFGALALGATAGPALGAATQQGRETTLLVRIENVSTDTTLQTTLEDDGGEQPVPLSPGAFAVHRSGEPIFTPGEPERNNGLEEIAEDGDPSRLADALAGDESVRSSGAFTTPVGGTEPAPIGPGGAYEFEVTARPEDRLSFATMFVPSNDLFYAPDPGGLPLFRGVEPRTGDVTDRVALWDAGTEINEEPGVGENQVQRQRGPGVGLVERGTVANIRDVNGYDYPRVDEVVQVTIEVVEETTEETTVATTEETTVATTEETTVATTEETTEEYTG
ncbi:spondin domain-containing protein [Halobacteriaceae archaeon GCM10025711]